MGIIMELKQLIESEIQELEIISLNNNDFKCSHYKKQLIEILETL